MVLFADSMRKLNFRKLMEVYVEGNQENSAQLWPDETPDRQAAMAEDDFFDYLKNVFFRRQGAWYAIWEDNGSYLSALRLEPFLDGLLLEALETKPTERKRGCAVKLIRSVQERLCEQGSIKVYSHVSKWNTASLRTHAKCGFEIIYDYAAYIDGSVNRRAYTLCWMSRKE